jgi:hypothetical protein
MTLTPPAYTTPEHRYLGRPRPVSYPVEAEVTERRPHYLLRSALFDSLREAFAPRATVGTDQFVYYVEGDATRCCAPDIFVRIGVPDESFDVWKTWERGVPQVAVEITSPSDAPDLPWGEKLARYRVLGAEHLVRFDPENAERPLQIWDRVDGDLVERDPSDPEFSCCEPLDAYWQVLPNPQTALSLRLSRDSEGKELCRTPLEIETEAHRREAEARAQAEQRERCAAARIRELEAELAKRNGR